MSSKKRRILIIENEERFFKEVSNEIQEKLGDWFDIYPKLKEEPGTINNFQHLLEDYIELGRFDDIIRNFGGIDYYVIDISLVGGGLDGYDLVEKIKVRDTTQEVRYVMISSLDNQKKCIWKGETDWTGLIVKEILKAFPDIAKEKEKQTASDKSNSIFKKIYKEYKENGLWNAINLFFNKLNKVARGAIHLAITCVFYFLLALTTMYATVNMYHEFWPVDQVQDGKSPMTNLKNSIEIPAKIVTNAAEKNVLEHAEKIFLFLLPLFIVFGFYIYYATNTRIYFNDGRLDENDRETSMHAMNFTKSIFVSSLISYTLIETVDEIFTVQEMEYKFLVAAGLLLLVLIGYFILLSHHKSSTNKPAHDAE